MRYLLLIFFLCGLLACTKSDIDDPGSGTAYNVDKNITLQLVNDLRKSGCTCGNDFMPPVPILTWNDQLAQAAYDHSRDMNRNNFMLHVGSDGSDPGVRLTRRGYNWRTYAENIAKGYMNEQEVINAWISSPSHCRNLMNNAVRELGMARDGNYWTMDLGVR